jgi:hypothetical protein
MLSLLIGVLAVCAVCFAVGTIAAELTKIRRNLESISQTLLAIATRMMEDSRHDL